MFWVLWLIVDHNSLCKNVTIYVCRSCLQYWMVWGVNQFAHITINARHTVFLSISGLSLEPGTVYSRNAPDVFAHDPRMCSVQCRLKLFWWVVCKKKYICINIYYWGHILFRFFAFLTRKCVISNQLTTLANTKPHI